MEERAAVVTRPWSEQRIVNDPLSVPGAARVHTIPVTRPHPYPLPILERSFADVCSLDSFNEKREVPRKWFICALDEVQAERATALNQPCYTNLTVVSVPGGTVDFNSAHVDIVGTIFTDTHAILSQPWQLLPVTRNDSWWTATSFTVHEFEELGVGYHGPYPVSPGHIVIESFPQIVLLLRTLPKHVPILVADYDFTEERSPLLAQLLGMTGESMDRFVVARGNGHYYRARKLHYLTREGHPGCMDDANKWQSREWIVPLREMAHAFVEAQPPAVEKKGKKRVPKGPYGIVIDRRPDNKAGRDVPNHDAMMEALATGTHGCNGLRWESFVGSQHTLIEAIRMMRGASIVVGPHGAGFFHLVWATEGVPVVELGYDLGPYPLPSTYYALAVALGLPYSLSIGNGNLGGSLEANVEEVAKLARRALVARGVCRAKPGIAWTLPALGSKT